jgi:hypothetical protein
LSTRQGGVTAIALSTISMPDLLYGPIGVAMLAWIWLALNAML